MSIYYELKPKTGKSKTGEEKTGYYPVVKRRKVLDVRALALRISNNRYIKSVDVESDLRIYIHEIKEALYEGNVVSLDEFGSFSMSIKSKTEIIDPKSIRSEQIEYSCINFRTNPHVKTFFSTAKFEKYNVKYSYVD